MQLSEGMGLPNCPSLMNSVLGTKSHVSYRGVSTRLTKCLNRLLNMKVVVAAFNQGRALIGSFSVIMNLLVDLCLNLYYPPCLFWSSLSLNTKTTETRRFSQLSGRLASSQAGLVGGEQILKFLFIFTQFVDYNRKLRTSTALKHQWYPPGGWWQTYCKIKIPSL